MVFLKKNLRKMILAVFLFMAPIVTFAQATIVPCEGTGRICNPLGPGLDNIPAFIQELLIGVLKIGIPIVALAVIYCGFLFVKAMGKPEELTKAKNALLYTLIGAAILLGSWAIALLISETVIGIGKP